MKAVKILGKLDSIVLSEYILQRCGKMSHLKLQKLLYYAEAMHLAYFDNSLIDDDFQAWLHGPVSRKLYDLVKGQSILYTEVQYEKTVDKLEPSEIVTGNLTSEQLELLNDTLDEYGKLSSNQLEALTHDEEPWLEARIGIASGDRCENIISKETMRRFYKKELFPF